MTSPEFVCANWHPDREYCEKNSQYTCQNCHLVVYCGQRCQRSHWSKHKLDCRSDLGKTEWEPAWVAEKRQPAFVTNHYGLTCKNAKYIWGTLPAYDVLKIESHEGVDHEEGIKVLFAESGDLRNVVKSIVELPAGYKHPIKIVMSDGDLDIVARNLILLLIALVVEDKDEAIDCMIHTWYSATFRKSDLDLLHQRIFPLIWTVCKKIKNKDPKQLLCKTWTFGERSLSCTFRKSTWARIMTYFQLPNWMGPDRAEGTRRAVTLSDLRKDFLERDLCFFTPKHRVAYMKFRRDGLLLPFGHPRHEFFVPNPTFYSDAIHWPMEDDADPRHGWPAEEVGQTYCGPARADMYGKLFYYLRATLRKFLERLSDSKLSFQMIRVTKLGLGNFLSGETFDRIEASNPMMPQHWCKPILRTSDLSPLTWTDLPNTVGSLISLLKFPSVNPHATLITLFEHAVDHGMIHADNKAFLTPHNPATQRLLPYLPITGPPTSKFAPEIIKWNHCRNIISQYDYLFYAYTQRQRFPEYPDRVGAAMAERNTIIEHAPFYLRLQHGEPGAMEEFERLIVAGVTGKERYVEWKRTTKTIFE